MSEHDYRCGAYSDPDSICTCPLIADVEEQASWIGQEQDPFKQFVQRATGLWGTFTAAPGFAPMGSAYVQATTPIQDPSAAKVAYEQAKRDAIYARVDALRKQKGGF